MTKRLLILADPYGRPSFAPRLRYLCQHLADKGWQLDVYTERWHEIPFEHTYPITEISFYNGKFDWALKAFWSLLTNWKERHFAREVRKHIAGKTYDAVFCTTFSTFPLGTACAIAKEHHLPLFLDIRDVEEQVPGAQYQAHRQWWAKPFRSWYRAINIQRRNQVLSQADCITTVSPWHVDFLRTFNPHTHLVYNGFDPGQFFFEEKQEPEFLVSYIGKIYEFQHPKPLFELLQSIPGVELNLHLPDSQPIPITQVGNEIRRSSIMLVLTDPSAKGMMTTKFYEALGCEKPIICYPSDDGLLAEKMAETNAGIATSDSDAIRAFVAEKYKEWQTNGFTRQDVRNKEQFSRQKQAEQIEKLLEEIV